MGNWTYAYDLVGNLITQRQNGGGNLVTGDGYYREYDGLNQLIKIRNGSTSSSPILENYTYDPFGQRIKISRNDTTNTTVYIPFKELMRIKNSTGTFDFTYVYQEGILVARVNPDGSKYFYHPDHLGSTTLITDSNGNVVENSYYSPYGELLGGGLADPKLYTGQFKDQTNTYMLCNVPYKPEWGLRLRPDPIVQNPYNPQFLNRYSYALGNPYKYKDPCGKYLESAVDVAFITMDIRDIQDDPTNLWNYGSLIADIGGLAAPGLTGGRVVVKGAEAGINAISSGGKITDISRNIEKAKQIEINKQISKSSESTIAKQEGGVLNKQPLSTSQGKRIPDVIVPQTGKAFEVKVGRVSATKDFKAQIAKDIELVQSGVKKSIQWVLFESPITGKSGFTRGALKEFEKSIEQTKGAISYVVSQVKIKWP